MKSGLGDALRMAEKFCNFGPQVASVIGASCAIAVVCIAIARPIAPNVRLCMMIPNYRE